MVFHVAEVTLRESYTYRYKYTNRQVIDAAIEVINTLMSERDYSFDFLVENLWFRGWNISTGCWINMRKQVSPSLTGSRGFICRCPWGQLYHAAQEGLEEREEPPGL